MRNPPDRLLRALASPIQVGLNPCLSPRLKHGTVTFEVSGFGLIQRDFLVNDRDLLLQQPRKYAVAVARQIMLLDRNLPYNEALCRPIRIDIRGTDLRRVYDLPAFGLVLQEPL